MTEVEIVSFSAMLESKVAKCESTMLEEQGGGRGEGENTANITQGSASFTGSVSGGVGVGMGTGLGVRVAGLDSTDKLSVIFTGW